MSQLFDLVDIEFPWNVTHVKLTDIIEPINSRRRDLYHPVDKFLEEVTSRMEDSYKTLHVSFTKTIRANIANYVRQSRPDLYYQDGGSVIQRIGAGYRKIYQNRDTTNKDPTVMTAEGLRKALDKAGKQDFYNTHTSKKQLVELYKQHVVNDSIPDGITKSKGVCIIDNCQNEATHSRTEYSTIKVYCPEHGKVNSGYLRAYLCIECEEKYPSWYDKPGGKKCLCRDCANSGKYPDAVSANKRCETEGCSKAPSYGYATDNIRRWCQGCAAKIPKAVPLTHKKCIICNQTRACFGTDGSEPKYCKKCSEKEGIDANNVVSKKCEHCNKRLASYGPLDSKTKKWCPICVQKHSLEAELKTGQCKHENCTKQPRMGLPGGKITHCKEHATEDMILLRKLYKCKGCGEKKPTYGYKGHLTHCIDCKKDDMVRYQNYYCYVEGCDTIPTYGHKRGDEPISCLKHKLPEMIDVCNRMCKKCGDIQATYGHENGSCEYCTACKLPSMVDLKHRKCDQCPKIATYGREKKKPLRCYDHSEHDMFDVLNKRCRNCGLVIMRNKSLCAACDPDNAYLKKWETLVVTYLKDNDLGNFVHDRRIKNSGVRFRPDILYTINDGERYLIVEVDENQHRANDTNAEKERMYAIHRVLGKPCTFIRYNPDAFKLNGKRMNKRYPEESRLELLRKNVKRYLNKPKDDVYVCYVCYDGDKVVKRQHLNYCELDEQK